MYAEFENAGATFTGDVFEPDMPNGHGVVLCHGLGTNRNELYDVAEALRDEGFVVLAYDERAHGQSEGIFHLDTMVDDVHAARRYLENAYDVDRIGMFGHSLGGYLAARAAAERDGFDAVVTWAAAISPREVLKETQPWFDVIDAWVDTVGRHLHYSSSYKELRIDDMGDYLANLYDRDQVRTDDSVKALGDVPYTLIQGDADKVVSMHHAKAIAAAADTELVVVPDCGHSCLPTHSEPPFYLPEPDRPEARREVIATVVGRFQRYLVDAPGTR
ncbi:MAG: alpha/beta fold hydrolase [Candidatus Undinarchaeales archaeon]|nr:alpha/beta fold hydrolase [Candidatus Undinarchaeales archaeon]